jgi:(4S)-4-hydroxy-5-phosphonooxypentane-2,3-dione isomerase
VHAVLVYISVKPSEIGAFVAETRLNCRHSVQEPENIRFDFMQDPDESTRFVLYEVYRTVEAARAHKQTPHYLAWREAVAEMMSEPRKGVLYDLLEAGEGN